MADRNQEIQSLLLKYGGDTRQALKENKQLPYLYALSELRENLLEWYPFDPDGSLLQFGADFGALTGLFASRLRKVTVLDPSEKNLETVRIRMAGKENVSCACGSLLSYAENHEGEFSYVSCIGSIRQEESREEQVQAAQRMLAPGGVLILAAPNRFGLRYLAGTEFPGVPFTRNELLKLLPGAEFYYPMPDYRLPSEIFSDGCLPKKGDLSGAPTIYDYPEYLTMDLDAVYDAACEDGRFDEFAGSFLVFRKKGV